MNEVEIRWFEREIVINPDTEYESLYEDKVLQYKNGYGEWTNVPTVREDG